MDNSRGIVKFFNEPKGYGFIVSESGKDVFFHVTHCIDKVKKDDLVTFTEGESRKGTSATNVKKS